MKKTGTTLSLRLNKNVAKMGEQVTLTAELIDEKGNPVPNVDVDLYLTEGASSTKIGSSKTNSAGLTNLTFEQEKPGVFPLQARFKGSSICDASTSDTVILTREEPINNIPSIVAVGISFVAVAEAIMIGILWKARKSVPKG